MNKRVKQAKKNQARMIIIALAIIIVIMGVTIVYAALSHDLIINVGKITQSTLSWDVKFRAGTVTPVESGTNPTGRVCGAATVDTSTISVPALTLSKPNDVCSYAVVVENNGKIDATLATIAAISPDQTSCNSNGSTMVCGNITYILSTDAAGNSPLVTGGVIVKLTGTQDLYLVIKYTGSVPQSSKVEQAGGGFTLVYNQK